MVDLIHPITHVLVSLNDIPAKGMNKLLIHIEFEDKELVDKAAEIVRMSQQNFMRAVLVSAAKKVLEEAGVK